MIYRCQRCGYHEARGFLPIAGCGIYSLVLMGCVSVVSLLVLRWLPDIMPVFIPRHRAGEIDWGNLLRAPLSVVVAVVAIVIATFLLKLCLELLEYMIYRRRICAECGASRWSWGFTHKSRL